MNIAEDFAKYIADAGFGTLGTDIFVSQIPDSTNGLWVERMGGQQNNYVPIEESAINIYSANTNASSSISVLEDIKSFVHRMHTTTTQDTFVYTMLVIGNIEEVSRDLEYMKIYKLTVQLVYRNTSLIS